MAGIIIDISESEIDDLIETLTFVGLPLLDNLVDRIVAAAVSKVNEE